MKTYNYLLIAMSLFFVLSCNDNVKYKLEDRKYDKILTSKEISLDTTLVISSFNNIFCYEDVFIIQGVSMDRHNFHIIDKNGKHLKSFCYSGRAKGEVAFIKNSTLNGGILFTSDVQRKNIEFDIKNILRGNNDAFKETNDESGTLSANMISLGENKYIVLDATGEYYLGLIEQNELKYKFMDFPGVISIEKEDNMVLYYDSSIDISPDGSKLVIGTNIGAILDIIDISSDAFSRITTKNYIQPKYKRINNQISSNDETIWGFDDLFLTDKYIYAVLSNCDSNNFGKVSSDILVLNWNGKLEKRYKADNFIRSIAIDNNGDIYAAAFNNKGGFSFFKYD